MSSENSQTEADAIHLHTAGATVRHQSSFSHLETPRNAEPMSAAVREKWVVPFYMQSLQHTDTAFLDACIEATPELTLMLLGDWDWRPRTVAARFAAVRHFVELQPQISNLLLKSELCYVGRDYCLALASFGNESAANTLAVYLDYYLRQPQLWFDQGVAFAALHYLDGLWGTNKSAQFTDPWLAFTRDKPNWQLAQFVERFQISLDGIDDIRELLIGRQPSY